MSSMYLVYNVMCFVSSRGLMCVRSSACSSATHLRNNYKSSAPEDGHKVARNMLSNL